MSTPDKQRQLSDLADLLDQFGARLQGLDEARLVKAIAFIKSDEEASALYRQSQRLDDQLDELHIDTRDLDQLKTRVMAQITHLPQRTDQAVLSEERHQKTSWLSNLAASFGGAAQWRYGAGLAASIFVGVFLGNNMLSGEINSLLGSEQSTQVSLVQDEVTLAFDDVDVDPWDYDE